jgi:hypothetical protein
VQHLPSVGVREPLQERLREVADVAPARGRPRGEAAAGEQLQRDPRAGGRVRVVVVDPHHRRVIEAGHGLDLAQQQRSAHADVAAERLEGHLDPGPDVARPVDRPRAPRPEELQHLELTDPIGHPLGYPPAGRLAGPARRG